MPLQEIKSSPAKSGYEISINSNKHGNFSDRTYSMEETTSQLDIVWHLMKILVEFYKDVKSMMYDLKIQPIVSFISLNKLLKDPKECF